MMLVSEIGSSPKTGWDFLLKHFNKFNSDPHLQANSCFAMHHLRLSENTPALQVTTYRPTVHKTENELMKSFQSAQIKEPSRAQMKENGHLLTNIQTSVSDLASWGVSRHFVPTLEVAW